MTIKLRRDTGDQRVAVSSHERIGPRGSRLELRVPIRARQDMQELRLATERLGDPVQTMRWILALAGQDLNRLRREELTALTWDLLGLIVLYARGWHIEWTPGIPLPKVDLSKLQIEVAGGLKALVQKADVALWPESTQQTASLASKWDAEARTHRYRVMWGGSDRDAIIAAIWNVIVEVGDKLRSCTECGTPFVAVKRQEYCTPSCSQRARIRRRPKKTGRRRRPAAAISRS